MTPPPFSSPHSVLALIRSISRRTWVFLDQPTSGNFHTHTLPTGTISFGVAAIATKPPPTNTIHPASAVAIPAKRPTSMHDVPSLSSPPPSPGALPQPAKRLHATTNAPHKSPQDSRPEFGADLDPFFIAHNATAQRLFDENHLAWGTVYEIARGITKGQWTWAAVTGEKIDQLRGTNARAAHQVAAVMQCREVPRMPAAAAELWCVFVLRPFEALIWHVIY